jgi:hypothetical protein
LVLLLGFFQLDLVDFDAVFRMIEAEIDGECVGIVDVFSFGMLGEWAQFGTGEGLEGAFDFGFGCGNVSKCALHQSTSCSMGETLTQPALGENLRIWLLLILAHVVEEK